MPKKKEMTTKQLTKKVMKLEEDNEQLLREVTQLRNFEINVSRALQQMNQSIENLNLNIVWHTHQRVERTGPMVFRKEDFERATGMTVDENGQIIPKPQSQPPQTSEGAPVEDDPDEEDDEGE